MKVEPEVIEPRGEPLIMAPVVGLQLHLPQGLWIPYAAQRERERRASINESQAP